MPDTLISASSAPIAWQRCFIGLTPDLPTRTILAAYRTPSQARATLFDDLHLTLAFLGGLTQEQAETLADALPALALAVPPLRFDGLESWPEDEPARVMVATYRVPPPLAKLVENVQQRVRGMGLPVDARPFRAHVTLARYVKRIIAESATISLPSSSTSANPPAAPQAPCRLPAAAFTQLALYTRSDEPGGPRYRVLAQTPLRAMQPTASD